MKRQQGFTLVELLIASSIGLVVIGGFLSIFLSNMHTFRVQHAVEDIQEDARFVLDSITSITQNSGYLGCYGGEGVAGIEYMLNTPSNTLWDLTSTVEGFNDVATSLDVGGITDFVSGSDVLILKRMHDSVLLNSNTTDADFSVDTDGHPFSAGQIMIISDCDKASIFQATSLSNDTGTGSTTIDHTLNNSYSPGNNVGEMNNSYNSGAEVGKLETKIYYLKSGLNGRSALFEASLSITSGTTVAISENEMLANVDDLQIIYGEDTNDDKNVDFYRNADDVTNWNNVLSLQILLLISSEESNITKDSNSYSFIEADFTYTKDTTPSGTADHRFRRTVTGIGTFRNRTL